MTTTISNSLVGLSLLTGANGFASLGSAQKIESAAVRLAKAGFTLAPTTPPWKDPKAATTTDSAQLAAIKRLSTIIDKAFILSASRVLITFSDPHPEMANRELDEIAAEWGVDRDTAAERLAPGGAIYFCQDEKDVQAILAYPPTMIGSDGLPGGAFNHPRTWGSFPRVLGHYARDLGLFDLETAVHKMTGLTARRFGIIDRGKLAVGAFADVTVFDPTTVIDRATFAKPTEQSVGIRFVLVNGAFAWREGAPTGARPGRPLPRRAGVPSQTLSAPKPVSIADF